MDEVRRCSAAELLADCAVDAVEGLVDGARLKPQGGGVGDQYHASGCLHSLHRRTQHRAQLFQAVEGDQSPGVDDERTDPARIGGCRVVRRGIEDG